MKPNMGVIVSVLIAAIILIVAYHFLTKKKVNVNTGEIKTSFIGFDGSENESFEGENYEG